MSPPPARRDLCATREYFSIEFFAFRDIFVPDCSSPPAHRRGGGGGARGRDQSGSASAPAHDKCGGEGGGAVRPLTTGIMATTAKRGKKGRKNDLDDDGGGGGAAGVSRVHGGRCRAAPVPP
mmetsp:Transcript_21597/g.63390  ORF Transcript_21597/g.63390 Transcript_21597/m.63390 type:complete len:122 (+) Transcript_21597:1135-1500(+)